MQRLSNFINNVPAVFYMFDVRHLTNQLSAAQLCVTEGNGAKNRLKAVSPY